MFELSPFFADFLIFLLFFVLFSFSFKILSIFVIRNEYPHFINSKIEKIKKLRNNNKI